MCPTEGNVQQSSAQTGVPKSTAKEEDSKRQVRKTFKILREVWLNIRIEKVNTHKGVTVKALLDSGITGIFMDKRTAAKHGFKLQKLERPIMVRNIDRTNNSRRAIIY